MSKQSAPPSKLPWDRRPVTARDMALLAGVMVVTCITGVALTFIAFTGPSRGESAAREAASAAPETEPAQDVSSISGQAMQASGTAEAGAALFQAQCAACHTIGGGALVGPDLEGVTARRDGAWLRRWIADPDVMLAEGDPIATEMLQTFNNVPMPNLSLSQAQVEDVLTYLGNPGGGGAGTAAVPLPEGNAVAGRELFTGAVALQNGGPACMSCHNTAGAGALGGGTLGPDLSHVLQRYGVAGLPTTLQSLPFPTMQGVFGQRPLTEQEAADLYAYFVQIDQAASAGASRADYAFAIVGLVSFVLLLLSAQLLWRRRLKAVRKPLLGGAQ